MILYLMAIASPTHAIPAESWRAWRRPVITFDKFSYIGGPPPLFVRRFRARVARFSWTSSARAAAYGLVSECGRGNARAEGVSFSGLGQQFPGYTQTIWGVTASDSRKGYVAWGGPPRTTRSRRQRRPLRGRGIADAGARHHAASVARDAPPLRRSHLRALRVRRCLSSDRRMGQPRRHRHRRRHHARCSAPKICARAGSGSGSCATRRSRRRWSELGCYHRPGFSTERGLLSLILHRLFRGVF